MSTPPFEGPSSGPDPGTIAEEAPPNPPNEQDEPIETTTEGRFDPPPPPVEEEDEFEDVDDEEEEFEDSDDEKELLDRIVRDILGDPDQLPLEDDSFEIEQDELEEMLNDHKESSSSSSSSSSSEEEDDDDDDDDESEEDSDVEVPRVVSREWALKILRSGVEPTKRQRAIISQYCFVTGCKTVKDEDMFPDGIPDYDGQRPSTSKDYDQRQMQGEKNDNDSSEPEDNAQNIPIRRKLVAQHIERHSRIDAVNRIRDMRSYNKEMMNDTISELKKYSINWKKFRQLKPRCYYDESDSSSPEREPESLTKINGHRSPHRTVKKDLISNGAKKTTMDFLSGDSDEEPSTSDRLVNGVRKEFEDSDDEEQDDEDEEEQEEGEGEGDEVEDEEGEQEQEDEEVEEEQEDEEEGEDEAEDEEEEEEEEEEYEDDEYISLQKQKSENLDFDKITRREMRKRLKVEDYERDYQNVRRTVLQQAEAIQKRMVEQLEQMTTMAECSYVAIGEEKNRFLEEIATSRHYNRIRLNLARHVESDEYREANELPPEVDKPVNEIVEEEKKYGLAPFPGYEEEDTGGISEIEHSEASEDDENEEEDEVDDDDEYEETEESEEEEEEYDEDDTSEAAIARHVRRELEYRWKRNKYSEMHEPGPSRENYIAWQMRQLHEAYDERQQYRAANPSSHHLSHPVAHAGFSVYGTRANTTNKLYDDDYDQEMSSYAHQQQHQFYPPQPQQQPPYSPYSGSPGALANNGMVMTTRNRSGTPQQAPFRGDRPFISSPAQLVHSSSSSQLSALGLSNYNSNHNINSNNQYQYHRDTYSSPRPNRNTPQIMPNGSTHNISSPPVNNLHMTPTYGEIQPNHHQQHMTPVHTRSGRKGDEMDNKKENVETASSSSQVARKLHVKDDEDSNDESVEMMESSTSASSAARMQRKKKLQSASASSSSSHHPEKKSRKNNDNDDAPSVKSSTKRTRTSAMNNSSNSTKAKLKNDDEPTYCVCSRISFGEMIGCDNDKCEIEWFHFECVNLSNKPKGKWYCPNCRHPDWGAKLPNTALTTTASKK